MSCLLRALNTAEMPDVIPLTAYERRLKAELEAVVSAGLETFLKVGHALAEIRSKRLFRTEYPTFKLYCRNKFSLAPSSADQLIRTAQTAGVLLEAGVNLSGAMEAAIRPFCGRELACRKRVPTGNRRVGLWQSYPRNGRVGSADGLVGSHFPPEARQAEATVSVPRAARRSARTNLPLPDLPMSDAFREDTNAHLLRVEHHATFGTGNPSKADGVYFNRGKRNVCSGGNPSDLEAIKAGAPARRFEADSVDRESQDFDLWRSASPALSRLRSVCPEIGAES